MSKQREARDEARRLVDSLEAARERQGMTRDTLAKRAGNAVPSSWSQYVYADRLPGLDTFIRYARAVGYEIQLTPLKET